MKTLQLTISGICCLVFMTACVSQNSVTSWHFNSSREDTEEIRNAEIRSIVETNDSTVALMKHDIKALLQTAEQLKQLESNKKIADKFWNSRNIFAVSAIFALGQNDEKSFERIVKNEPDFASMRSMFPKKTRGGVIIKNIAIPEIAEVNSIDEAVKLPANKRAFWGMYAKTLYPEIPEREFAIFCNKINLSRSVLEPEVLAKTAVELSKFKAVNVPECFTAKNLFNEAVDAAILLHDKFALENIVELYKSASFKTEKGLKRLQAEVKAFGKTRRWNERKIRRLQFTDVRNDGESYTVTGNGWSRVKANGYTRVRHFTGREALAYKIKKFYEE